MILPYLYNVEKSQDLRKILSQNIRSARKALNISQAKLAEYVNISVPHMTDIEYCKTWLSDKTLASIAKALNMETYELLIPGKSEKAKESGRKNADLQQTAKLIAAKKRQLRKKTDESMDDLLMEIIKLHGEKDL